MKAIRDAIEAIFDGAGGAALRALVGDSGLLFTAAPVGRATPYIIYYSFPNNPEWTFAAGPPDELVKVEYQFSAFNPRRDGIDAIEAVDEQVKALYEWATLSITGYNFVSMEPTGDDILAQQGDFHAWRRFTIMAKKI